MRAPVAAAGGGAARVKLSWKRLLRDAFGDAAEGEAVKLKRLRKRACAAAEAQYQAAGQEPPDRAALEAKFDAKLAASRRFVLAGKRVRRATAGGGGAGDNAGGGPHNGEEEEEEEKEEAEGRLARSEAAKQRPSYIAWHTAPKAQRFGQFSASEKAALDAAIEAYAEEEALDPKSLEWLYHTRVGKRQRAAWLRLAEALPHRSPRQVWGHATRRLHSARAAGPWGEEETAALRRLVAQRGRDWVAIGAELGRRPDACRDRWRKVDKPYAKGAWTEAECDTLKEAVAAALAARAAQPTEAPSAGIAFVTRDNLDWSAIAAQIGTRSAASANQKWYADFAPSMRDAGTWGAGDDGRLLRFLRDARAGEETEVDWAAAVSGRGGAASLRRWKLMLKHVPGAVDRGFSGCVAFLVEKFADKLKDAAEDE